MAWIFCFSSSSCCSPGRGGEGAQARSEAAAGGGSGSGAAGCVQPHAGAIAGAQTHLRRPHKHWAAAGRGKGPPQAAPPGLQRWAALGRQWRCPGC